MLARNYKTADELGVFDETRDGLIAIMHELRDGRLPWSDVPTKHPTFNMMSVRVENCCCIKGRLQERGIPAYGCAPNNLVNLFYPGRGRLYDITPAQAADAIERFLQGEFYLWS